MNQKSRTRLEAAPAFLSDLLDTLTERGRALLRRKDLPAAVSGPDLVSLGELLLSRRGEASGVALAQSLLAAFAAASSDGAAGFPAEARRPLRPRPRRRSTPRSRPPAQEGAGIEAIEALHAAAEPRRQELIRRLNLAPGGTAALVRMREELLRHVRQHPELRRVDADFAHLFASWFNRGFLVLRHIDWTTPANILEKIIRYEAVHAIQNWDDLRNRLEPTDRRCYGFFHPQLVDEPLIFVEVALTEEHPGPGRRPARPRPHPDRGEQGEHRGLLFDLQHPEGAGGRLVRQLPHQAGGRGPEGRAARHPAPSSPSPRCRALPPGWRASAQTRPRRCSTRRCARRCGRSTNPAGTSTRRRPKQCAPR